MKHYTSKSILGVWCSIVLFSLSSELLSQPVSCEQMPEHEKDEKASFCTSLTQELRGYLDEYETILSLASFERRQEASRKTEAITQFIRDINENGTSRLDEFQECSGFLLVYGFTPIDSTARDLNEKAWMVYMALRYVHSDMGSEEYDPILHGMIIGSSHNAYLKAKHAQEKTSISSSPKVDQQISTCNET